MLTSKRRHIKHKTHYQDIVYQAYICTGNFLQSGFKLDSFVHLKEHVFCEISAVTTSLLLSQKDSHCDNKLPETAC